MSVEEAVARKSPRDAADLHVGTFPSSTEIFGMEGCLHFLPLERNASQRKSHPLDRAGRSVWATVVGARKAAEKPLFPTNKRHTPKGCYPNTPIWFPIDMGISAGGRKCGSSDPARFVRTTTVELRSDRRR